MQSTLDHAHAIRVCRACGRPRIQRQDGEVRA
jgi:hypothetical protein